MRDLKINYSRNILLAVSVTAIGYLLLRSVSRTGLVDMCVEFVLFSAGSIIAFNGFRKSNYAVSKNFKRFQLYFGLTYSAVAVSFLMGILYFLKHPNLIEIGVTDLSDSTWLIVMSSLKAISMVFLIVAWLNFYRYLNIKASAKKKTAVYVLGTLIYLGLSVIIWQLVNDISVLSLGLIVGSVIGIFAMIALDSRTRYLTFIFAFYSVIHLIEFYLMGIGQDLTAGLNNPVYWGVTVLYVIEVKRWIDQETKELVRKG